MANGYPSLMGRGLPFAMASGPQMPMAGRAPMAPTPYGMPGAARAGVPGALSGNPAPMSLDMIMEAIRQRGGAMPGRMPPGPGAGPFPPAPPGPGGAQMPQPAAAGPMIFQPPTGGPTGGAPQGGLSRFIRPGGANGMPLSMLASQSTRPGLPWRMTA